MRIRQDIEQRPDPPKPVNSRLKALDVRIDRAREDQQRIGAGGRSKSDGSALGLAVQFSAAFVSSVAAGGVLGWGIDWLVGSSPWGLITCLLLGFCAGMFSLLRAAALTQNTR